jgi:hypothetical protein
MMGVKAERAEAPHRRVDNMHLIEDASGSVT